jgi:hypothetical protein
LPTMSEDLTVLPFWSVPWNAGATSPTLGMSASAEAPIKSERTANKLFIIFISVTVMDKAGIHNREIELPGGGFGIAGGIKHREG